MASLGERDRDPPRPGGQLQDRAARPAGQGQIQVEVARILDEVEVVQAGQGPAGGGGLGVDRQPAVPRPVNRTGAPSRRLTASALMASSAARLAIIAVVSAWS